MRPKLSVSIALFVVALHTVAATPLPKVTFLSGAPPVVSVPPEVLIGEDFTFTVTFDNRTTGSTVGYGPFIDLVFDAGGANLKRLCATCDGIKFVSAKVVGVNGGPASLNTFPVSAPNCNPAPTTVSLTHPFASSGILPVTVPAGGQLVTLELPFGSYDPTQPVIAVEVTAHVSNFADEGVPLTISARGGFRYGGTDALDNPTSDPPILSDTNLNSSGWSTHAPTTPRVMIIKKECSAPEDETATGPNHPRTYTIKVDIANGQSIAKLKVQDILPNNVQYVGNVAVKIHTLAVTPGTIYCNGAYFLTLTPSTPTPPGGTLEVSFCNPIIGAPHPPPNPPDDVTIKFTFYIPEKDANGNPVLSPNCTPALSINPIHAEGDWTQTPPDPCDTSPPPPLHVISNVASAHKLSDKCLTIRKTVTFSTSGPKPGDIIRYDYFFDVSDYLTIGQLVVRDFLADGQDLVPGSAQLTVKDQFGTKTGSFPAVAITSASDLTGASQFCPHPLPPPLQAPPGGTVLTFNISQAMGLPGLTSTPLVIPRQNAGLLTGGYAAGAPPSAQPATGTVRFFARIRDDFHLPVPGDKYVDKDDPINNCIVIDGQVYQNMNRPSPINKPLNIPTVVTGNASDDSATHITIITDTPKKTIYAVKRGGSFVCKPSGPICSNFPNPPQEVRPGDEVTFRIQKTIPTSDAENLTIQDWLPLPIFDVSDPDANGSAGPSWNVGVGLIPPCAPPPPGPGKVCRFTPSDTLGLPWSTGFPTLPTLVVGPLQTAANSIEFDYGTFHDTNNNPRKIDLLFTSTVTNQPFADGLFLTNEMQECETNTFGEQFCQVAVAQVKVREPKLVIKKGVVATNNPNGIGNPPLVPFGKWKLWGFGAACPRFNPPINHVNLPGLINTNLYNVDANDWATFAIAIENTGGAPAYEIELADIMPLDASDNPSCFMPDYSSLCVRRGNGVFIPVTTAIGGQGRKIFKFPGTSLLPLDSTTAVTGTNIAIITFNAQLLSNIKPGCCDNRVDLLHYTSQPGGPDFVGAGFTPPFSDTATICVGPKALAKCIVQTSEAHTAPQNSGSGTPPVAMGEIIRYRLIASVPEGFSPNYQIKDLLPLGLTYLGNPKVGFVSTNPASLTSTTLSGAGLNFPGNENTATCAPNPTPVLTFQLQPGAVNVISGSGGDVTFSLGDLTNSESDADLELVVIEFNALVDNISSNQNGTQLINRFELNVAGQPFDQNNAISVDAVIFEPKLTITKAVSPATIIQGGTVSYTVTITTGVADAFDLQFTDTLPAGLTFVPNSTTVTGGCSAPVINATAPSVTCSGLPVNGVVTIKYSAVANSPTCPATLTNQAKVTWTSLPGPNGTMVNPTGSSTPGSSGAYNGERNGTTAPFTLNSYAASTSMPLTVQCQQQCLKISNETVTCNPNGTFNYSFAVTNLSSVPAASLSFSTPSNITISPSPINIPFPPNVPTNVSVTIGGAGAVSGANVCFSVSLAGPVPPQCTVQHCVKLPSCQIACAPQPAKMVSWWPLNETSGNTVIDIKSGHNGNTANIGTDPSSSLAAPAKVGKALFFMASKATVSPGSPYNFGMGNFSIDAWVKGGDPGNAFALGIVDKLDTTANLRTGFAFFVSGGKLQLLMGDGTAAGATYSSSGSNGTFTYSNAIWQHVAVTVQRSGGSLVGMFYINGAQAGTPFAPPPISVNNSADLLIGNYRLNPATCPSCDVALDEIEIFDAVVPPGDIKAIFDAGSIGKCP